MCAAACHDAGPMTPNLLPRVFAHRGVSVSFVENTIEAFSAAEDRGADGVELDVRRTADGVLVVHHDAHLADGRAIVELDAARLPASIPNLADALDACGGLMVNIEIKNFPGEPDFDPMGSVADATVEIIRVKGMANRVIVSGFNYEDIQRVRSLDSEIPTGWLVLGVPDPQGMVAHLVDDGHQALHPPVESTDGRVVEAAHERGIAVNTWTVDDPERIIELAEIGVDAVITNDPVTARSALEQWHRSG